MIAGIAIALLVVVTIAIAAVWLAPTPPPKSVHFEHHPDRPRPFGYKMAWIAVRTEDIGGVAEALGFSEAIPANWNSGLGTVYDDALGAKHIFIAPPVNGWTFVVGLPLPHPVGPGFVDKLTPLLLSLGKRYPEVQYFITYPLIDFFAWARVSNGRLLRGFAVGDEGIVWNKGKLTKEERALGLKLFELRGVNGRQGDAGGEIVLYPTEDHVLQIAGGWGIDPMGLGGQATAPCHGFVVPAPAHWRPERVRRKAA